MQTVNEKLLTELKSSPAKTINGEMVTLIDEDLRTALIELLSQQSEGISESDEEAANYYAECCNGGSRGSGIIQQSFLAGRQSLRQQLSQQQQQRDWISVKEKEPEHLQSVLVTDGKACYAGVFYDITGKICLNSCEHFTIKFGCTDMDNFTHWQPLPPPPTNHK